MAMIRSVEVYVDFEDVRQAVVDIAVASLDRECKKLYVEGDPEARWDDMGEGWTVTLPIA